MAVLYSTVSVEVQKSKFLSCTCNSSGGAIAAVRGVKLTTANTAFVGNAAGGLGGGAIYSLQVLSIRESH